MTTKTYVLHLNGGPKDDQTIAYWASEYWVAGSPNPWPWHLSPFTEKDGLVPFAIRKGCYRVRIDSNGDFVPHDLTGAIEADWQGWE